MKNIHLIFIAFLLLQFNYIPVFSQQKIPFLSAIEAFKKQDSINSPPKGAILLVGSSSFTNWKDVQDYFPGYTIINRGFGGSSLPDLIRFAPDIIYPYNPSQILIYCGENDFPSGVNTNADTVYNRFRRLFGMIRANLPKSEIIYVSMKPSPSRIKYLNEFKLANEKIRNFLKKKRNTAFIDVYSKMILSDGSPMTDIFLNDNLHMNKKGYYIWQSAFKPYLKK